MPTPNPQALEFMLTRRSRPAKTLQGPAPDANRLKILLSAAARSPDHGKLEPWRFIVFQGASLRRLAAAIAPCGMRLGKTPDDITKAQAAFADSPLCVAVIEIQRDSPKVPAIEQSYSSGAVCLALLNAALADGWGANWLSGWASHDRGFTETELGLATHERVAGFIHIGTERAEPPERPRPDMSSITTWVDT